MRRLLALAILFLVAIPGTMATQPQNPYPNELPGFKFYAKYLTPLRPYVSEKGSVVRVLGSDQGTELGDWRIRPLFMGKENSVNGHAWARDLTGRLANIELTPRHIVSMQDVKFPAAFTHSLGGVSEINVSCDVYSDIFGLQYWIYAGDSSEGKKGDLMQIVYGPSKRIERQTIGPT